MLSLVNDKLNIDNTYYVWHNKARMSVQSESSAASNPYRIQPPARHLRVLYVNARSIHNTADSLEILLISSDPH